MENPRRMSPHRFNDWLIFPRSIIQGGWQLLVARCLFFFAFFVHSDLGFKSL